MDILNGFFWLISTALYGAWWLVRGAFTLPLRLVRFGSNRRKAQGSARWAHRWEQWWYGAVRGEGITLGRGAFGRANFHQDSVWPCGPESALRSGKSPRCSPMVAPLPPL